MQPTFPLGHIVATPGALHAICQANQSPAFFLDQHAAGMEDLQRNERNLIDGKRLLSAYRTLLDADIVIITTEDRSCTMIMLLEEFEYEP